MPAGPNRSRVALVRTCLALALAGAASAQPAPTERPFLYRIDSATPSYLYGTIHLPDPRVLALPRVVRRALDESAVFCSEVRMDADTAARAAAAAQLPGHNTLRDVLPTELYARAEAYLAARDLDIERFARLKVWAFAGLLPSLDRPEAPAGAPSLDALLRQRAARAGKRLDALEKAGDQIALIDSVGLSGQRRMLEQSLDYLEALEPGEPGPVERITRAYLEGDEQSLVRVAFEYVDLEDPQSAEFMEALLDRRNLGMASGIERRLLANPELGYFFAVGALHVPGPEGVVKLLEKRGFRVERVRP